MTIPKIGRSWNRLVIFAPGCSFNPKLTCTGQTRRNFCCPLQDGQFLDLLDFYFMGGVREEGSVLDRNAVPGLKCKEVSLWFDNDFHALEAYCHWKATGHLQMTYQLCREFRRAWCRYYVRLKPLGVWRPRWMRGYDQWKGTSVEYCKQNGVAI